MPTEPGTSQATGAGGAVTWPDAAIRDLADAILHTIVYADLFDYPLTTAQIHRYLMAYAAPYSAVADRLAGDAGLRAHIDSHPPYWFLAGRRELVEVRQTREAWSQALWRKARGYGRVVTSLPFVRMAAVTGSLAMDNVTGTDDDIDFLIVTRNGRVWFARGLVLLLVHAAARQGIELCPNYVLAEQNLGMAPANIYTAHELAQMVPLSGAATYRRLFTSNTWIVDYLPNAVSLQARTGRRGHVTRRGQRLAEATLSGRLGDAIERWEQERKIPRLRRIAAEAGSRGAIYTPQLCKGHADDHAAALAQRFAARIAALGL
jgi:hypothetical protein